MPITSYISFRYFLPIIQLYIITIFSANNPAIYHSHIICQLSSCISFPYYMPIIQLYIIPILYANYPVIYHAALMRTMTWMYQWHNHILIIIHYGILTVYVPIICHLYLKHRKKYACETIQSIKVKFFPNKLYCVIIILLIVITLTII